MKKMCEWPLAIIVFAALQLVGSASFCGENRERDNDAYTILLSIASNDEYEKVYASQAKYSGSLDEAEIFATTFEIKSLPANGFYANISAALEKIGFFKTMRQMADCEYVQNPKFWENKEYYKKNDKLFRILFIIGMYGPMLDYKVISSIENGEYDIAAKLLTGYFNSLHFFFKQPNKSFGRFCAHLDKKYGKINANLTNAINRILAYDKEYYKNNPEEKGNSVSSEN